MKQHGEKIKKEILLAGVELWKAGGMKTVTCRAVAEKIGKTHGTVSYHFGHDTASMRNEVAAYAVSIRCVPIMLQLLAADHSAIKTLAADEVAKLRRLM